MNRIRTFLSRASRSRSFLWKFAFSVILVGVAAGLALSHFEPPSERLFGERVLARAGLSTQRDDPKLRPPDESAPNLLAALATELSITSELRFTDVLRSAPSFAPYVAPTDYASFRDALRSRFSETEAALATDYLGAWLGGDRDAFARLKTRADSPEPPRFTRYVLGRLELRQENHRAAHEHFRAEAEHPDAWESRYMAVLALAESNDPRALDALHEDPRFAPYFTPHVALAAAVGARNWLGILEASSPSSSPPTTTPSFSWPSSPRSAGACFSFTSAKSPRHARATSGSASPA